MNLTGHKLTMRRLIFPLLLFLAILLIFYFPVLKPDRDKIIYGGFAVPVLLLERLFERLPAFRIYSLLESLSLFRHAVSGPSGNGIFLPGHSFISVFAPELRFPFRHSYPYSDCLFGYVFFHFPL